MNENPEREILLKLLRAEPVPEATAEQWLKILQLSRQHKVESLLYWQLKRQGPGDQVPSEIWKTLWEDYLQGANRNIRIYHELGKILSAFNQAEIPVIPLKGAYLAAQVYGNIAARPMGDVDLLVRKEDLWRAEEIITKISYLRTFPDKGADASWHVEYQHSQTGLHVEIHWNLVPEVLGLPVDIPEVWKRTRPVTIAGVDVTTLSPEDMLLHLCIHASDHVFAMGLILVCDIRETLRHYQSEMDWDRLQQRASLWRARRCAYVPLWFARNLLDAPIPEACLEALQSQEPDLSQYLTLAEEQLFTDPEQTGESSPARRDNMQNWYARNLPEKLAILFRRIFLSRQVMAMKYRLPPHSPRLYWYYLVRLKELLQVYGRQHKRLTSQDQAGALRSWLFAG